jgi:copper oxidase (laccase) domain-containing protein
MFDLPAYLKRRMTRQGVGAVVDMGLCTYSDEDRFYSYRRATHRQEKDYGRQISGIVLSR